MKIENSKQRRGNVLFLILIAVALFAALSYAVTQSSHTPGPVEASKQSPAAVVNTGALTQYPSSVRTAVLRMIVNGVDPTNMLFNKSDQLGTAAGYTAYDAAHERMGVFNQAGGAASYQQVPASMMANNAPGDWAFTLDFEIPLIGLSSASSLAGNDLVAFASGLNAATCGRVNQDLYADATIPVVSTAVTINNNRIATTTLPVTPSSETVLASTTPTTTWFQNKTQGCFQNGAAAGSPYVFFYVLAER